MKKIISLLVTAAILGLLFIEFFPSGDTDPGACNPDMEIMCAPQFVE